MTYPRNVGFTAIFLISCFLSTAQDSAIAAERRDQRDAKTAKLSRFSGIAKTSLLLEAHGPRRCDLHFFRAKTSDSDFSGLSGDFHVALFPQELELDNKVAGYADCGNRSFGYSIWRSGIARFFPGKKPYFIDPFANGAIQQQLSVTQEDFSGINSNDALTEHDLWRHISAIQSYVAIKDYSTSLAKGGVRYANYQQGGKVPLPKHIVMPSTLELGTALKVARGAQVRVYRALLWQYEQMKNAPYFSIEQCAAFGAAFEGLGQADFMDEATTEHYKADYALHEYERGFYYQALPHAMASFGQIAPVLQSWNDIGSTLQQKVYRETKNYSCLTDQSAFIQDVANKRFREISDAKVALEKQVFDTEIKRRTDAYNAAAMRNARAGSGDYAPIADDLVRALINARREANASVMAMGEAMFGKDIINDQFDYETGLYVENYTAQKNAIQHFVKAPQCSRVSKAPVVYDCNYDVRFDITVSVFGMSLPKFSMPFVRHKNQFEFINGQWSSASLAKAYAEQRRKGAASASSYDHSKGIKEFQCISSNSFADQFGLVRNIDC